MHKSLRTSLRIYRNKEKENNENSWNIELATESDSLDFFAFSSSELGLTAAIIETIATVS